MALGGNAVADKRVDLGYTSTYTVGANNRIESDGTHDYTMSPILP